MRAKPVAVATLAFVSSVIGLWMVFAVATQSQVQLKNEATDSLALPHVPAHQPGLLAPSAPSAPRASLEPVVKVTERSTKAPPATESWSKYPTVDAAALIIAAAEEFPTATNAGTLLLAHTLCIPIQLLALGSDSLMTTQTLRALQVKTEPIDDQVASAAVALKAACAPLASAEYARTKRTPGTATSLYAQFLQTMGRNPSRSQEQVVIEILSNPQRDPAVFDQWLRLYFGSTPVRRAITLTYWQAALVEDELYRRLVGIEHENSFRNLSRCAIQGICRGYEVNISAAEKLVATALADKVEWAIRSQRWDLIFRA